MPLPFDISEGNKYNGSNGNSKRNSTLAKQDESPATEKVTVDLQKLEKRVAMLYDRLDNIDSIVSAVAERIMKQQVTFNITCSHCGHKIEIALIGTEKPTK
jgi:hypothetical protein